MYKTWDTYTIDCDSGGRRYAFVWGREPLPSYSGGGGVCGEDTATKGRMLGFKGLARAVGGRAAFATGLRAASTVGGALEEAVARLPHKEALRSVKQDLRYSFQELSAAVDELANGFVDLKFATGDVLAVWLPNNAENVCVSGLLPPSGVDTNVCSCCLEHRSSRSSRRPRPD